MNVLCEGGLHVACDGTFYDDASLDSHRCVCECHVDVVVARDGAAREGARMSRWTRAALR